VNEPPDEREQEPEGIEPPPGVEPKAPVPEAPPEVARETAPDPAIDPEAEAMPEAAAAASAEPPSGLESSVMPWPRSRYLPAVLDAVVPGLGHLVAGRRRRALVLLAPLVAAIGIAVGIVAGTSAPRLAASLLSEEVIWGLLATQGLVLAWRLAAVGSSLFNPALPRPGRRDLLPIVLLLVVVVAPQAFVAYATEVAREAADQIFVKPPDTVVLPSAQPEPDPSFLTTPPPSPSTTLGPGGGRITGLILGVDSGVGRSTYLTDTMIIVSLDPATRTVSMLSIPRDMVDVPLPDGRQYRDKINSLVAYARHNPAQFPGSDGTGFDVLRGALGTLVNLPIDFYAKVDLGGFVRVVDVLGGVDVNVARAFCDPGYDEYGFASGFSITAGRHHLNGEEALAYARVRKASGESDFTRAARQQEVISGIRDAIVGGGFLLDPIGLLQALGRAVETNLPRGLLPDLAELAGEVGREQTYRAVVNHPLVTAGFDVRGSIQIPNVEAIRALAAELFPIGGVLPSFAYALPRSAPGATPRPATGSGVGGCAPAPTPSPAPSLEPGPTTVPEPSLPTEPSPSIDATPPPEPTATPEPPATPEVTPGIPPPQGALTAP
jgi:LCP family protein required for cell wall assembly